MDKAEKLLEAKGIEETGASTMRERSQKDTALSIRHHDIERQHENQAMSNKSRTVSWEYRILVLLAMVSTAVFVFLNILASSPEAKRFIVPGVPIRGQRNIFFVESTCAVTDFPAHSSCTSESGLWLCPRAACSIEAAARAHPERPVVLVHTCPFPLTRDWTKSVSTYALAALSLPNIRVWSETVNGVLAETPLQGLLRNNLLRYSPRPEGLASDLMRFALLWRFGGTSLDADVVLLRNVSKFRNFVYADTEDELSTSILDFSADAEGESVAHACINEFMQHIPQDNAYEGRRAITDVMKKRCQVDKFSQIPATQCGGFNVLSASAIFPPGVGDGEDGADETMEAMKSSLGVHLWSKLSAGTNVSLESQQPYAQIARRACPSVAASVDGVL